MISDAFDGFYTTPIEIGYRTDTGSYSNPGGVYTKLCDIKADVQPYNSGLLLKDYGMTDTCEYKMFTKGSTDVRVGNLAVIEGVQYIIIMAQSWGLGCEAVLKKIR